VRHDLARQLVETDLARRGLSVYRLGLGDGPALVARDGIALIDVAVASAIESRGRVYPPSTARTRGAAVLAYVTSDGAVRYVDPSGLLEGMSGAEAGHGTCDAPEAAPAGAVGG
jgi:hypothetical protein